MSCMRLVCLSQGFPCPAQWHPKRIRLDGNSESAWILQLLTQESRIALHLTAVSKMFQSITVVHSIFHTTFTRHMYQHNVFAIWINLCQLIPNKWSGSDGSILGWCLQASNIIRKGTTCQLSNCSQYWMVSMLPKCPEESRVSRSQSWLPTRCKICGSLSQACSCTQQL